MTSNEDVVWFAYRGLEADPEKQFRQFLKDRHTRDVETKLGKMKILKLDMQDGSMLFSIPEITPSYINPDLEDRNNLLLSWREARSDFLKRIKLPVNTFVRLVEYGEYQLLVNNIKTFQKHVSLKNVRLRLVRIPGVHQWVIRAILSDQYIETNDGSVLETTLKSFKNLNLTVEPYDAVVTETKTRLRYLFPTKTFEFKDKMLTPGIEILNSEVGKASLKVFGLLVAGSDETLFKFPFPGSMELRHWSSTTQEILAGLIVLIKEYVDSLDKIREAYINAICNPYRLTEKQFKRFCYKREISKLMQSLMINHWNRSYTNTSLAFGLGTTCMEEGAKTTYRNRLFMEKGAGELLLGKELKEYYINETARKV